MDKNYKKMLKELENGTTNGAVRDYDLKNGLADRILAENWKKQDEQWKVEYAKEMMSNKDNKEIEKEEV